MNTSIVPVSVWPGSAVALYIAPGFSASVGGVPIFSWQLLDQEGSTLKAGGCSMTVEQWNQWSDADSDESYIVECVLTNLGLEAAK